jgi:hypothetical protein
MHAVNELLVLVERLYGACVIAVCTCTYAMHICNTCAHWRILRILQTQGVRLGRNWPVNLAFEGLYFDCRPSCSASCPGVVVCPLCWVVFSWHTTGYFWWMVSGVHTVRRCEKHLLDFRRCCGFSMRSGQIPHLYGGWDGECDSTPSVANRNALDKVRQSLCSKLDSFKSLWERIF